ncbi:MAG: hypothetical protein IPH58_18645 [Sphingobacteriales bacterium]|nr:hypothetical protein [Sphingobacteriales bacterium]
MDELIKADNKIHKIKTPRKPERNDFAGCCGINNDIKKAIMAIDHQGR